MFNTHVIAAAAVAWMIGVPAMAPSHGAHGAHVVPKPSASSSVVPPQLDIAVADGRTSVAEGDRLTYTIKVRNLGTTVAKRIHISESLPAGLKLVSTDHGSSTAAGRVDWVVDLNPGAVSTLTTTGQVGPIPAGLLRLATVACAATVGGGKPLVCATHSDLLPSGAASGKTVQSASHRIWYGIGVLAIAAVGASAYFLRRRRNRLRPTVGPGEDAEPLSVGAYMRH